ncbi:MAG TPA: ATP-binding protein [Candidatus Aquilonibacter sp.]|nr:ATP-binding protein [Candidatus Aquilonibacter sp.]
MPAAPATVKAQAPKAQMPVALPHASGRGGAKRPRGAASRDVAAEKSLSRAFETFQLAARSLEKSYGQLQAEVLRLRFELERTNRDLASSLEENARMRVYLSQVIEGLPCGVVVTDRLGRIRMANPEAKRVLAPVMRGGMTELAVGMFQELLAEMQEEDDGGQWEREWPDENGERRRTVGITCAVLGDGRGEGAAGESVFLLRDVTEEKECAARGERMRRRESLAEMATLLAHEIRNPLGSLELFAGLLADAAATQPDLRRWTDHIQAGLRLLSATVNNVLQYHSQPKPQLKSVNLGRLLRESVDFLRPLARQAGLRIDFENSVGEVEIPADAHRLQQVFFNLAVNAFRAMNMGGTLSIRAGWENPHTCRSVEIEIEDTGCGIAVEHLEKIFEPGYTLNTGNPGLGLAVCRAVVEQHEGTIRVKSEPKAGTTFTLTLPRER